MLDHIDIHIEVPRVNYEKLSTDRVSESSEAIRARIQTARNIQRARFSKHDSKHPIFSHADMRGGEIRQFCQLQPEGGALSLPKCQSLMGAAMGQLQLSARAYAQHNVIACEA